MPQAPAYAPKKRSLTTPWRIGCLAVWALGLLALLALAVVLFVVRPDPIQWLTGLARLGPKPACDPAQLSLGGMTFRIQDLARSADGSIPFPADSQGSAFWIEGTTPHYVFALSPAIENLKLAASVKEGDVAKITWTDCSSAVYSVRAVEVTSSHTPDLFDKPGTGLTVFVQADTSGAGVALRSELVQAFAAPTAPSASTEVVMDPVEPVAPVVPDEPLQTFQPPDCGGSRLSLGAAEFTIQTIAVLPDGSIPVPPDRQGVAYWVDGTNNNYVFALSPTPDNLALESSLTIGDQATITWANCNSTTYYLSAPQPGSTGDASLFEQSAPGITLFIPSVSTTNGFSVRGGLVEEQLLTIDTPVPGQTGVQAEVSLLETTPSADGKTIQVKVSIFNYGGSAFTVTANDVSLAAVPPTRSKPALPEGIKAGATKDFTFTFPRPSASPAVLKIFDVEFDVEF